MDDSANRLRRMACLAHTAVQEVEGEAMSNEDGRFLRMER